MLNGWQCRKFAINLKSIFPHNMKLDSSETVFSSQELLRFVILQNFRYTAK